MDPKYSIPFDGTDDVIVLSDDYRPEDWRTVNGLPDDAEETD